MQAVIFGCTVGVGVAALAIDVGLLCAARGQIQRTADSAALAGASGLMDLQSSERAEQFAHNNEVANYGLLPADLVITTGMWNGVEHVFTPTPEDGVGGTLPNAVRVEGTRSNMDLLFARALGVDVTVVRRPATALAGSGHCAGIWGLDGVTCNGGIITDSYDPTVGGYGPGNVRPNGDVCSCGDITVHGSSSIRGDAMYGEGHQFNASGHSYEVLGMIDDHACQQPDIDVDYPYFATHNDNVHIPPKTANNKNPFKSPGELSLTGSDHLTLPPGTYYLNSAKLAGQAYLEITGPTKLYINGAADFTGGGLVNTSTIAENLVIYAAGPTLDLKGGAVVYGGVVAPNADVKVAGDFNGYGAVLGKSLTVSGNIQYHVDEGMVFDLFGDTVIAPILVQ
jgi:hypothetical protein